MEGDALMADLHSELEKIVERHRLGTGCMSDEGNDLSVRALRAAVREAADAALEQAVELLMREPRPPWADDFAAALRREKQK